MFHICFCTNEPYAKYTAVLMTSIIQNTDSTKHFSDFFDDLHSVNRGGAEAT